MTLWTPFRAGERLTAGRLNALVSEWTPYTPIWSAEAGTTTLGDGLLEGKFQRVGNTVHFRIFFKWGSTTTQSSPGQAWRFTVPAAPQSADGSLWWPVSLTMNHASGPGSPTPHHVSLGIGFIDPTLQAVANMYYNMGNSPIDDRAFPSYYAETLPSSTTVDPNTVSPDESNVVVGDTLHIFGSYEAIG